MSKLDEIADYAQHHDFAAEMDQCTWETGTETDPMVTTSVRLPKSLLDWVRQRAAAQHLRPSALIRQWIEQCRAAASAEGAGNRAARVERLERAVFPDPRASGVVQRCKAARGCPETIGAPTRAGICPQARAHRTCRNQRIAASPNFQAARSLGLWRLGSVPLGEVLAQRAVDVLVGNALAGALAGQHSAAELGA